MPTSIYDFEAQQMNGKTVPLSQYKDTVLLMDRVRDKDSNNKIDHVLKFKIGKLLRKRKR